MFNRALYYPYIDISDEVWLKNAALYWDHIQTIVPMSIKQPYATDVANTLMSEGVLEPLYIESGMDVVESLSDDVYRYIGNESVSRLMLEGEQGSSGSVLYLDKLPNSFRKVVAAIHYDKLPYAIRDMAQLTKGQYAYFGQEFTNYYMTLLASKLSERVGAELVTANFLADGVAQDIRLDAMLPSVAKHFAGYGDFYGSHHQIGRQNIELPNRLASGVLATMAISKIQLNPDTDIRKIIQFKRKNEAALVRFKKSIEGATAMKDGTRSVESMRQHVEDVYKNEILPSKIELCEKLKENKIEATTSGLLKISAITAVPTSIGVLAGLSVPLALLAGAGISVVATTVKYNLDRNTILRQSPATFLMEAEKQFGQKPKKSPFPPRKRRP